MSTAEQWQSQRAYFDAEAAKARPFDIDVIARRYEAAMAHPLYPLEFAYAAMGDVRGKRILDVGCGHGENSLLFARWGAKVTGVDISEGAIAVCQRRARSAGLNANFLAMPFEQVAAVEDRFDVVWSAAFLHHVLDRLDEVMAQLRSNVRDDGLLIMSEPVRLSPLLKRLRLLIPPFPDATPDERPLERHDLAKITAMFNVKRQRLYGPISRITARVLNTPQEKSGAFQRRLSALGYKFDRALVTRRTAMIMAASLTPRKL